MFKIKLKYYLFPEVLGEEKISKIEPLKLSELIMLSVNTTTTVGTIKKINEKLSEADMILKIPIVPIKGESVGLARNIHGHWRLIGFAEIL
ncbi:MAG: hypothetical protein ACMUHX_08950 [bacterium]